MKVLVVGAGALGGYFGGKLAMAGVDVTFLVRKGRYQQLKQRGLRVHSVHGDFCISPKMTQSVDNIDVPDLVLLTVKTYHLPDVMNSIATLARRGARVLPLLNGVSHMDALRRALPATSLWGGVCYVESTLDKYGDVRQTSSMQEIRMGTLANDDSELLMQVQDVFTAAHIPSTIEEHIETIMWEKYLFLLTLSSVTTALRRPIGVALADPVTNGFIGNFVRELTDVAGGTGAPIDHEARHRILRKLQDIQPAMTSSMHRDLEKGQPIELDELQGYMVAVAQSHGIPAPYLQTVYALLHPFKNGNATENQTESPNSPASSPLR
jgi:2-dehydropantoate 2-reductase